MQNHLELLKELVNVKSYTSDRVSVNGVNEIIIKKLKGVGFTIKTHQHQSVGDLVIATFARSRTKKHILLSGHTDIVPFDSFHPFKRSGEKCTGSGIADMKGGLAVLLSVIETLARHQCLDGITCMFTPDEETGSQTYRRVMHNVYQQQDYAFIFEPGLELPNQSWEDTRWVVTKRKGVSTIVIKLTGDGGHAGNKLKDRNSTIEEMARKVLALHALTDVRKGITINVGTIRGGEATNVIAPSCECTIDLRTVTNRQYITTLSRIHSIVARNKLKVASTVTETFSVPPMEENINTRTMLTVADSVLQSMRVTRTSPLRGGGSDGNQMSQYGVGVLDGLGPVGGNIHTANEWVYAQSIEQSIRMSVDVIKRLQG